MLLQLCLELGFPVRLPFCNSRPTTERMRNSLRSCPCRSSVPRCPISISTPSLSVPCTARDNGLGLKWLFINSSIYGSWDDCPRARQGPIRHCRSLVVPNDDERYSQSWPGDLSQYSTAESVFGHSAFRILDGRDARARGRPGSRTARVASTCYGLRLVSIVDKTRQQQVARESEAVWSRLIQSMAAGFSALFPLSRKLLGIVL